MKTLLIVFTFLFTMFFLFGKVKINERVTNVGLIIKLLFSLVAGLIFSILLGLPLVGLLALFGIVF